MHIAVLGLGPAGALLAHRAASLGWTVDGYDPACGTGTDACATLPKWRNTYGLFLEDLPVWAREILAFSAVVPEPQVHTARERRLRGRTYAMVDCDATTQRLHHPNLRLHRRKVDAPDPRALGVDMVVDCRGVVDRPGAIRQVAYGVVVPGMQDAQDAPSVFMDWRPASVTAVPGAQDAGPPSFLYVQPVAGGTLYEETVLVTRAHTRETLEVLQRRLKERLGETHTATATETVHFPTDRRVRGWYTGVRDGVAVFGAAGGLTHPATGYSVAASAATVDRMLHLLSHGALPRRERLTAACAYRLRAFGAELLVLADAPTLRSFFDAFFELPTHRQTSYLAGQDAGRVALAMLALARHPRRVLPFLRNTPAALRRLVRR
ncbi:lycopene cyclase family protein [Corynebacterium sp. AOP40-9SA-29]|uniref:lycopene cyclase family protein n=1 Tax=Corynebacterium sp. AOP40-9SA-29 TaxID=3457677 RepID=UPI004034AF35